MQGSPGRRRAEDIGDAACSTQCMPRTAARRNFNLTRIARNGGTSEGRPKLPVRVRRHIHDVARFSRCKKHGELLCIAGHLQENRTVSHDHLCKCVHSQLQQCACIDTGEFTLVLPDHPQCSLANPIHMRDDPHTGRLPAALRHLRLACCRRHPISVSHLSTVDEKHTFTSITSCEDHVTWSVSRRTDCLLRNLPCCPRVNFVHVPKELVGHENRDARLTQQIRHQIFGKHTSQSNLIAFITSKP
mmetsp:Transcript_140867/g.262871  ORF Transcript_140867/g.262871 Transcript_140867/m.262871 type:complete len:245 (+) Transcript_140867:329-1063(+)